MTPPTSYCDHLEEVLKLSIFKLLFYWTLNQTRLHYILLIILRTNYLATKIWLYPMNAFGKMYEIENVNLLIFLIYVIYHLFKLNYRINVQSWINVRTHAQLNWSVNLLSLEFIIIYSTKIPTFVNSITLTINCNLVL